MDFVIEMLRITQQTSAVAAKAYYSSSDYFSEGQELQGQWPGMGAKQLGLEGAVDQRDWDAICDNLHPQTGAQLAASSASRKSYRRRRSMSRMDWFSNAEHQQVG